MKFYLVFSNCMRSIGYEPGSRAVPRPISNEKGNETHKSEHGSTIPSRGGYSASLEPACDEKRRFRDRYHRTNRHIMRREQSRRGLGDTDGFAFVSHADAVLSGRHPLGVGQGIPSPTSESYLPNSAILLNESRTGRVTPLVRGKTRSESNIAKPPELLQKQLV